MASLSWLAVLQRNYYSNRYAKEYFQLTLLFTASWQGKILVSSDHEPSRPGTFDVIARQIF
jgi:hypothetical protein